ncbi:helix-turn-helix domain-containing protein [Pedobacter panaciterrae]|jgi:hypothetical protein
MNFLLNSSTPQKQRAFIKKPIFMNFQMNRLKYLDVLTFTAVKSFDNKEGRCFPSYETIAETSGMSRDFIIKSIKRLEQNGYLSIYKNEKFRAPNRSYPNEYSFPEVDNFNPVPYEIFKAGDLTKIEKSVLLLIRQFAVIANDIYGSIDDFSRQLGLSRRTIYKPYLSLVKKGYLDNSRLKSRLTRLLKIDWAFPDYLPIKSRKNEYDTSNLSLIIT